MKDEKIEQGTVFDVVLDGLVLMALNSHYCNHLLFENQIKMIMNRVSTETFLLALSLLLALFGCFSLSEQVQHSKLQANKFKDSSP